MRRLRTDAAWLITLALSGAVAPKALAQSPCPDSARADALEEQGRRAREALRDDEARDLFQQAWEMCHDPRARARTGLAEAALGRWLDADAHLRDALASTGSAWIEANRAQLDATLANAASHLGEIMLGGNGPSATVAINGRSVGEWPAQRRFRALLGTAVVTLRADGFVEFNRTVVVPPTGLAREEVELVRTPPPTPTSAPLALRPSVLTDVPPAGLPAPRASSAGATSAMRTWGWIAVAGAVAGAAVGVVGSVLREGEFSEYEGSACAGVRAGTPVSDATYAQCASSLNEGTAHQSRDEAMQYAGFITAGVLGVAGAVLLLLPTPSSHASARRCAPMLLVPGGQCTWAF
ncbi:MAG: hypothetical protein U0326_20370 [Polyangiales bacterium]